MDALQGRVRVSHSRFKKLKKIVSDCDREIQICDAEIARAESNCTIGRYVGKSHLQCFSRWESIKTKFSTKRAKLDAKRKAARLELKGYKP